MLSRTRPASGLFVRSCGLLLLGSALAAGVVSAQIRRGDFPSWERDTETTLRALPTARQGQLHLALSVELPSTAVGLDVMDQGSMGVALVDGQVAFFDSSGELLASVSLGATAVFAPTAVGGALALALPTELVLVAAEGVLWRQPLVAAPVIRPVLTKTGRLTLGLGGGVIQQRDVSDGSLSWQTTVSGELSAGPALGPELQAWGTVEGVLSGLDEGTGEKLWTVQVGERIDAVTADSHAVFVTAFGKTGRTGKSLGPFAARVPFQDGGRRATKVRWRLRLGAACTVAPLLLDGLVGYPAQDGYIHAVSRKKGSAGWRTDLPSRVRFPPTRHAGRLDFALPYTGLLVSVSAASGGIKAWASLEDEDETFVGRSVGSAGLTVVATNFGRLVGFRFQADPASRE